jgi:cyanophycinase-like exopeptidase
MGRMNTFMARILKDVDAVVPKTAHGVGIDEHTALLLDIYTGDVKAVGVGTAYACAGTAPAAVCQSKTPLTFQGIQCVRLSGQDGDEFSFKTWSGKGVSYTSDIVQGKFLNVPYGPTSSA